jgi:arsenate reductase
MTIKLYGIRSCDSCRKASAWLEQRELEFVFHDIRKDGLSDKSLRNWQAQLGWEALLNRRSLTWRKIPSFDRDNLDAESAMQLILAYPTVMKRPLLEVTAEKLIIGFDEETYAEAIEEKS